MKTQLSRLRSLYNRHNPKNLMMRKYNLKVGVFDCTTAVQDGRFWCRMQIVWRQGTVSCPGTRSITNIIHNVLSTLKELCQKIYQNFSSWNHHQSNLRETKKYLLKTWKEGSSDKANTKWGTDRPDRLRENWNRWQNYCALITDINAFVTFRGPSLYWGKTYWMHEQNGKFMR